MVTILITVAAGILIRLIRCDLLGYGARADASGRMRNIVRHFRFNKLPPSAPRAEDRANQVAADLRSATDCGSTLTDEIIAALTEFAYAPRPATHPKRGGIGGRVDTQTSVSALSLASTRTQTQLGADRATTCRPNECRRQRRRAALRCAVLCCVEERSGADTERRGPRRTSRRQFVICVHS